LIYSRVVHWKYSKCHVTSNKAPHS
jgi:hypothetical protein